MLALIFLTSFFVNFFFFLFYKIRGHDAFNFVFPIIHPRLKEGSEKEDLRDDLKPLYEVRLQS